MKAQDFVSLATELFGKTLSAYGFSMEGSKAATSWRKLSPEVFHIIAPDTLLNGDYFDVTVTAVSPVVDPRILRTFPDKIGVLTAKRFLGPRGVGIHQHKFNCRNEENFRRLYRTEVEPLLLSKGLPFLDGLRKVEDILPLISNDTMRGMALHHLGRRAEAKPLLEAAARNLAGDTSAEMEPLVNRLKTIAIETT
ncbi:MAG: hypothetical protein K8S54_21660 [Spirochaetia bacterium]|nr:hypothetical protein [Spirochaetia bacterium]